MYGLSIPYRYLPLAQLAMSYIFTQQIPWVDIGGLFVGYAHYLWNDNLKPAEALPSEARERMAAADKKAGRKLGSARNGGGGGGGGKPGDKKKKARIHTVGSKAACGAGG
jgi:hypothetical protein